MLGNPTMRFGNRAEDLQQARKGPNVGPRADKDQVRGTTVPRWHCPNLHAGRASAGAATERDLRTRTIAVAALNDPRRSRAIHPLHAFLLSAAVPLFLGGFLSDLAYGSSAEMQWSNFAAWLILGAMPFTGLALLWSFITLLRVRSRWGWSLLCFVLLLATFLLGLFDNFHHARDA